MKCRMQAKAIRSHTYMVMLDATVKLINNVSNNYMYNFEASKNMIKCNKYEELKQYLPHQNIIH